MKAILNYGIKNPVLDWVDPGYTDRSEAAMKARTGQEPIIE